MLNYDGAVFLDANVLLEIILDRPKVSVARKLLKDLTQKPYISALTAHLVVHFGQEIVDLPVLRSFLEDYKLLPLEVADFEWAFINTNGLDFEDGLQVAIAVKNGCDSFLTFDKDLAKVYANLPTLKVQFLA